MTPTGKIEIEGETVYKVVARLADGRLVSPYAGSLKDAFNNLEVEYKVGEVVKSPTLKGLHIYLDKEVAIEKASKKIGGALYFSKTDDVRVHEAIALGEVVYSCVPALILSKEVWKPNLNVVSGLMCPDEEGEIIHKTRAMAGEKKRFNSTDLMLKNIGAHYTKDWAIVLAWLVKQSELYTDGIGEFPYYSTNKDAFEPEEVWEDVTEECTFSLGGVGNNIRCVHGLNTPFLFFANGVGVYLGEEDRGYGLAVDNDNGDSNGTFRFGFAVLQKVQ